MNIPDTTGHQMTVQFLTSLNVCSGTTGGKQNKQNINFCPYWYLIKTAQQNIFCACLSPWLTLHPIVHFLNCLQ